MSECAIKNLRIDGGGEYTLSEFAQFCENEGIEHEFMALYTPHYTDIVERKNMIIFNMARSMLNVKQILNHLWGKATHIIHIINKCLTKKLSNKKP